MPLQRRFKKPPAPAPSPETSAGPRLFTLKKSAEYLSAHPWALRQLVRSGQIPHISGIGRGYLIDRVDLDRYVAKNKTGGAA